MMRQLTNKRILLGITGGIAAYKSAELVRQFTKAGAEVQVVMTRAACEFITPLTMQALSHNPVHLDLLDPRAEAAMGHIELAKWADIVVIAPATADFMARLANGHADDLLTTLCLATQASICLAPAMNQAMWTNSITQENFERLKRREIRMFGPAAGSQACGDVGYGRMLEPEAIAEAVAQQFEVSTLAGKTVLITAGGTQEAIDPVRYISNRSSGKMGYALADAAAQAGAQVILISGPSALATPQQVTRINVVSAQQMYDAVHSHIEQADIFIGCAAVGDYRPQSVSQQKIKKDPTQQAQTLTLTLVRNPDIIASVAALVPPPFTVGFAAETEQVLQYAQDKLQRKGLNLVVANNVASTEIGFNSDDNEVIIVGQDWQQPLPQASKRVIAKQLIEVIAQQYQVHSTQRDA